MTQYKGVRGQEDGERKTGQWELSAKNTTFMSLSI